MKKDPELWSKLLKLNIDTGNPELSFSQRLARENQWSSEFTDRVMLEYYRFIYLCRIADTGVTPSTAVDQAWHLHLCYTHSYWDDLCRDLLEHHLHHGPTRGGQQEDQRYLYQYAYTIRLYEQEFEQKPPHDIWPSPEKRFAANALPFWTTKDRFYVMEKSRLHRALRVVLFLVLGLIGFIAVMTGHGKSILPIATFLAVAALAVSIGKSFKNKTQSHDGTGGGGGCSSISYTDNGSDSGSDGGGSGCGGGCGGGGD
jgi:hypothetical protein